MVRQVMAMGKGRFKWVRLVLPVVLALATTRTAMASETALCTPPPGTLVYKVFNDDTPTGEAHIQIDKQGDKTLIRTTIDVSVSILFLPGVAYRHTSEEIWQNGTFVLFEGKTDNAGKKYDIRISALDEGVRLHRNGRIVELAAPLMTWAIWCEAALGQGQTLDPLKGKLKLLKVTYRGEEQVTFGGRQVTARRYFVVRKKQQGDLWYGPDGIIIKAAFPSRIGTVGRAVLLPKQ